MLKNRQFRSIMFAVSVAVVAMSISSACAQDPCVALIKKGLYDTYRSNSGNSNLSQAQAQFCSDFNSFGQTGQSGNLGVSYGLFSGSANFSQNQIEAVGQAMCSSSLSNASADAQLNTSSSIVDPNITSAFSACVAASQHGLIYAIEPRPDTGDILTISAHFEQGPGSPSPQHVDSVTIDQAASLANFQSLTCTGPLFAKANQQGA
jgi:hypothetical protein